MSSLLRAALIAVPLVQMAGAALAQVVFTEETLTPYASVRGWTVDGVEASVGHVGCRAWTPTQAGLLMIEQIAGSWRLIAETTSTGQRFVPGILDVDRYSFDGEVEIIPGYALRPLSGAELQAIKAGDQLGLTVPGDAVGTRWYPLTGSTAAVLKVEDCVQREGRVAAAAPPPAPAPAPSAGQSALLYPVPVGETQIGDCQMGFTQPYRCLFEGLPPKAGYLSSTRLSDLFGEAPTLDLDAVSGTEADVWALLDGTWLFMGRWVDDPAQGRCLVPAMRQTPDAEANLGQDAWQICLL